MASQSAMKPPRDPDGAARCGEVPRREYSEALPRGSNARALCYIPRFIRTPRLRNREAPMRDPRNARLAEVIVKHSTRLMPGEACLVEAFDVVDGLVLALVEAIHAAQAI